MGSVDKTQFSCRPLAFAEIKVIWQRFGICQEEFFTTSRQLESKSTNKKKINGHEPSSSFSHTISTTTVTFLNGHWWAESSLFLVSQSDASWRRRRHSRTEEGDLLEGKVEAKMVARSGIYQRLVQS